MCHNGQKTRTISGNVTKTYILFWAEVCPQRGSTETIPFFRLPYLRVEPKFESTDTGKIEIMFGFSQYRFWSDKKAEKPEDSD